MVIERYSNPDGAHVPESSRDIIAHLDNLYAQEGDFVTALEPGEYDITPQIWKDPTYNYNLVVLENGTGALRILPRHHDSMQVERRLFKNDVHEGGRTVKLPDDNTYVPIMGPNPQDGSLRIFEIVRYRPDEHSDYQPMTEALDLDDDDERIVTPIRRLQQAEDKIIKDAKRRVLALPWKKYGLTDKQVGDLYDMGYGLILRQAIASIGTSLPLNLLNAAEPQEKALLDQVRKRNKRLLKDDFWIVQLSDISPEQATFIRDWLWTKAPEFIAMYTGMDYSQFGMEVLEDMRKPLMRILRELQ